MLFSFSLLPSMLVLGFLNLMFRASLPKHKGLRLSYAVSSASPERLCSSSAASVSPFVDFSDILSHSNLFCYYLENIRLLTD